MEEVEYSYPENIKRIISKFEFYCIFGVDFMRAGRPLRLSVTCIIVRRTPLVWLQNGIHHSEPDKPLLSGASLF